MPRDWKAYKASYPDIIDALASPSGRLEVVITRSNIKIVADGRVVKEFAAPGMSVVLAQWALGEKNVARWRADVPSVLK